MYSWTPFLLFFLILINSFCLGKIIKRNSYNLSFSISIFIGFFIFCLVFASIYIPIILAPDIGETDYFFYSHIVVQIILGIIYAVFYKSFNFSLIINFKKIIPFVISVAILILGYFVFFLSRSSKLDYTNINIYESSYFSIMNYQLQDFFRVFSGITFVKNDFKVFVNTFYPILLIILASLFVSDFYSLKYYLNIKDYLSIFFISFLFSFFIFNVKDLSASLWADSFAMLICINSFIILLRCNNFQDNENYFTIIKISLVLLVVLNSTFIIISACLFVLITIYLFFKKIDFGFDKFVESLIFFMFGFSLFFLSKDFTKNTIFIILFSLLLTASAILTSIFYTLKKNYSRTTYWPYIQKTSIVFSKYFGFTYLFSFLAVAVVSITSTLSGLSKSNDFNIILSRIELFKFLNDTINYNALYHKELTNTFFTAFYFIVFVFSFFYLLINFKNLNNISSNLLFVLSANFLLFNPLSIFEIRYLSSFFVYKYVDNQFYDFTLFFNFLIVINLGFAIDYIKTSNIGSQDFRRFKEMLSNEKTINLDLKTNSNYYQLNTKPIKRIKNSIVEQIKLTLFNKYVYLFFSLSLSVTFATFIFVCN